MDVPRTFFRFCFAILSIHWPLLCTRMLFKHVTAQQTKREACLTVSDGTKTIIREWQRRQKCFGATTTKNCESNKRCAASWIVRNVGRAWAHNNECSAYGRRTKAKSMQQHYTERPFTF